MSDPVAPSPRPGRSRSRIQEGSFLDGKGVPLLLGSLALLMIAMIVLAFGVAVGWIPFQ
ncbi:MAG: hypothetical protein WD040_02585 [Anaerolineales bacterium]